MQVNNKSRELMNKIQMKLGLMGEHICFRYAYSNFRLIIDIIQSSEIFLFQILPYHFIESVNGFLRGKKAEK